MQRQRDAHGGRAARDDREERGFRAGGDDFDARCRLWGRRLGDWGWVGGRAADGGADGAVGGGGGRADGRDVELLEDDVPGALAGWAEGPDGGRVELFEVVEERAEAAGRDLGEGVDGAGVGEVEEGVVVEAGEAREEGVVADGVGLDGHAEVGLLWKVEGLVAGVYGGVVVL